MAGAAAALAVPLALLQLSDSAFPSGRYTLSYGLEPYAQSGLIPTPCPASKLLQLLRDSLTFGVGPSDGVALASAHRAARGDATLDLELAGEADRRLTAVKIPRETREASRRTGRALLNAASAAFPDAQLHEYRALVRSGDLPGNHAIVLGLVSSLLGIPRLEAVAGELYAFSSGFATAAVRLGLTDHRTAQSVLNQARGVTAEAALRAVDGNVAQISSCTPLLDVMSMRHEQAEVRLFAT
jgi:urease accessory protein